MATQQVAFVAVIQVPFNSEALAVGAADAMARHIATTYGYQHIRTQVIPVAIQDEPPQNAAAETANDPGNGEATTQPENRPDRKRARGNA